MQEERGGDVRCAAWLFDVDQRALILIEIEVEFGASVRLAKGDSLVGRAVKLGVERKGRVPQ